jgi:hypothetical protein
LKIESYEGQFYTLPLASNAIFSLDGIPAQLSEFKAGIEVYALLQGKQVISLEGYVGANPGYITPGSKVRTGTITALQPQQLEVKLATAEKAVYGFGSGTIVIRNGQTVGIDSLYEGDRVKLYFDTANSNYIGRIQVEGISVEITGLYKGVIKIVDSTTDTVSLDNVMMLRNGEWIKASLPARVPFNQANIYSGGYRIPPANLKYYRGKTIYAAGSRFFGQERLDKIAILNQYEANYQEKIDSINWYTEALEMTNNKNLAFNDGTIIIKSGRLVDKYALNQDSDIVAVADGRGGNSMADVVYVLNENLNNSAIGEHYLYAGRLDEITADQVNLRDFYLLDDNKWVSFRDNKELYYDSDTAIINLQNGQVLSAKDFLSGSYAVDENSAYVKDHGLSDWFAYIYADGDRIAAVGVQPQADSLLSQRSTCGSIERIEQDLLVGWTLTVRDARDWSPHQNQWMVKNSEVSLNLEQALLYKNGKLAKPAQLTPADRVYILRDDFNIKLLLVK